MSEIKKTTKTTILQIDDTTAHAMSLIWRTLPKASMLLANELHKLLKFM